MSAGRLMIVEDDLLSSKLLGKSVEGLGYEVVANVHNAEDAIEAFKSNPPDVLLLDFQLKGAIDGSDLAQTLSAIKKTPTVFITSAEDEASLNKILAAKPDGYIQKPLEIRELRAVLEMAFYKDGKEKQLENLLKSLDNKVKERTKELDEAVRSLIKEMSEKERIHRQLEKALENEKKFGELKSSIISNLSHEFKTPLSAIRSSAQLLRTFINKEKFEKLDTKHTDRIDQAVDVLTNVLNRILSVEKGENEVYEAEYCLFDFDELMKEVIAEVHLGDCRKTKLTTEGEVGEITSDPKLIKLILSNLISNACKYAPVNGKVSITVSESGQQLNVSVSDNGIGMSEEDLEQIFYRFYRGHNVGSIEGTGIGMSIVHNCLKALKGTIEIQSTLGKGSTFDLTIPLPNI